LQQEASQNENGDKNSDSQNGRNALNVAETV
jgi:hypothetical protein